MKAIVGHRLFWPLFILVALLVATRLKSPIFFDIRVVNGNLYGSLITIVRRTAPTLLVALGMTLVIATRGIDLSVGAVAAIAGAAAATFIDSSAHPDAMVTVLIGVGIALLLSAAGGVWNGFLVTVLGIQPIVATLVLMTAGRGVAQLITDERIITPSSRPYHMIGGGYWLGRAVLDHPRRRHPAAHRPAHAPHRARNAPRVGRRQPGGLTARRRAGPVDHLDGVHRVRRVRRSRRPDDHVGRHRRRPEQHRAVPRDRRHPRRRDRRARRSPAGASRSAAP